MNGPVRLTTDGPDRTVFDDNSEDTLSGDGGADWFLLNRTGGNVLDQAVDLSTFEALYAEDLFLFGPFVG